MRGFISALAFLVAAVQYAHGAVYVRFFFRFPTPMVTQIRMTIVGQ